MANTLTGLIPDAYRAIDIVSRELTGFIPAVMMDAGAERAAVGQTINVPISPAAAAEDVVPGTNPPDTGDQTIPPTPFTISKARAVPFRWTGEEQRGVNAGPGYANLRVQQIVQAMRTLANEVDADLASLYTKASRATGTAGTTPFASSVADSAQALKILLDNGAPQGDLQLVIDTTAGVNLRSLAQLTKANEAGSEDPLRQGALLAQHGFTIRESASVKLHTKGTGAGYLVDNVAGYQVGTATVHVDTGTGTFVPGDIVTVADESPESLKYVIKTGFAGDGDGDIVLAAPGLRGSIANDKAVSIGANYRANMAFSRSAMVLVTRPPAIPEEGDMASDAEIITDPRTGLSFEIRIYAQYRRIRYEVALAWGYANIKPEHTAILLG